MIALPNFLIVSGEGRNVGKTILACNIISKFCRDYPLIGLKLTPHVHQDVGNAEKLYSEEDMVLYKETGDFSRKDSSRMIAAGANEAYLLQLTDKKLKKGLEKFLEIIGENALVVCESGRLQNIIKPGISLFLRHLSCQAGIKDIKEPDAGVSRIVNFNINSFDINLNSIGIDKNEWILQE